MAETCMEGIHYNPEQEDVTLERIEAEDGGSYHPDQAGEPLQPTGLCQRMRVTAIL